jgi:aminoglycoside phosphotransferase (APT) family kinase protein
MGQRCGAAARRARRQNGARAGRDPGLPSLRPASVSTAFPALRPPTGTTGLRWHVDQQHEYCRWALSGDGLSIPIIERSLRWLEEHWPADPGPDVLSWGDARIGNIIYDGFTPVAVLDWEMAALGPREVDVGWFIFLHEVDDYVMHRASLDKLLAGTYRWD